MYFTRNQQNFIGEFIRFAAKKDHDYVLLDGKLEKGTWKTMPNGIHVFLVNGKIEAGPESTIGKKPDELDWDHIHREETAGMPGEIKMTPEVHEDVVKKYQPLIWQAATISNPQKREEHIDRVWTKMAAEDNFHCIFMNTEGKESPFLESLTKAFSDYGSFPIHGTPKDQAIFYNDRVSLLKELSQSLPEDSKKWLNVQIENLNLKITALLKSPGFHESEQTIVDESDPDFEPVVAPKNKKKTKQQPAALPADNFSNVPVSQSRINNTLPNMHPGKPGPGGNNTPPPQSQPNMHPGKPGPGGQNTPPPQSPPSQKPNNKKKPPLRSPNTPVSQTPKPRAKNRQHLQVESILTKLFKFVMIAIARWTTSGVKKSNAWENKMLLKVTKHILSNTNVNERDNLYNVFTKTFGK